MSLSINPSYTFESFAVRPSNKIAYTTAKSIAEKPGEQYNPLFICGAESLGTTHLLQAIGNYNIDLGKTVIYVTLEQFMNTFISHLRAQTMDKFRDKFIGCDLLLMGDIHFLSRKEQTQKELFHIFRERYSNKKQTVTTSDRAPNKIAGLTDNLQHFFELGFIADIQPPTLEAKIGIIQKICELDGIALSGEMIDFIACNMGDNIREVEGMLIKLNAMSCMLNEDVTMEFVKKVIKDQMK